jgi:hypothetical protein
MWIKRKQEKYIMHTKRILSEITQKIILYIRFIIIMCVFLFVD